MQGAGRDVVLKEVRLTLDEARVRTLLLINVGGEVCLDLKLNGAFHAAAHGGGREREIPARARRREGYVLTAPRAICFMAGPRPRKQLLGGSSARHDFAALTVVQNFFGNPNGIGTFKLLEGADADIHSSYLLLLCDVDELSIFPSRAAPTSWSMFRTSIVGVAAVQ